LATTDTVAMLVAQQSYINAVHCHTQYFNNYADHFSGAKGHQKPEESSETNLEAKFIDMLLDQTHLDTCSSSSSSSSSGSSSSSSSCGTAQQQQQQREPVCLITLQELTRAPISWQLSKHSCSKQSLGELPCSWRCDLTLYVYKCISEWSCPHCTVLHTRYEDFADGVCNVCNCKGGSNRLKRL
jgi:hypothetical protein